MAMLPSMLDKVWILPTAISGLGGIWLGPRVSCPHRDPQPQFTLPYLKIFFKNVKKLDLAFLFQPEKWDRDMVSIMLSAALEKKRKEQNRTEQ